ncbi:hypothetical protein GBO22_24070, partial [Mycobacterium avium subsp. hominissuis]|nr:hypothetical protein [Mycobacterium avium subsp. hominissuis]
MKTVVVTVALWPNYVALSEIRIRLVTRGHGMTSPHEREERDFFNGLAAGPPPETQPAPGAVEPSHPNNSGEPTRSRPVEWCKSGRVSACGSVVATMP